MARCGSPTTEVYVGRRNYGALDEDPRKYRVRACRVCGDRRPRYALVWHPGGRYQCPEWTPDQPPGMTCRQALAARRRPHPADRLWVSPTDTSRSQAAQHQNDQVRTSHIEVEAAPR